MENFKELTSRNTSI